MICLILLLSLILRLVNLNQSLWLDEAVQAITAQNSFSYIFQEIRGDFHPPLYHFLMHFWVRIFGSSEISLRMPSVIFGTATIWVLYLIAKLFTSEVSPRRRRGLSTSEVCLPPLAAIFLATAPFHIYYSQEARMYSLAAFLTTGSFYFFLRILEDDRGWLKDGRGVGYFIFTLLALYTDYYCFLALLAQAVIVLVNKRFRLFIFYILYFIFYLPWLPMFITQIKTGMLATKSLPGWGRLVNVSFLKALPLTFIKFSIGRITVFNRFLYTGIILMIGLIYGGLILAVFKEWLREKLRDAKRTIIILWFFVPLIVAWLASLFVPNFQPFRLLLILPAFYLLLAYGISQFRASMIYIIVSTLIVGINLVSTFVYYQNRYFQREDWRGVVGFLKKNQSAVVILPSETSNWPIEYYDSKREIKIIYGGRGVEKVGDLGDFKESAKRIFYIRYLVPLFDPSEKILAELGAEGYTKVKEISFNQIPLWEYQKK